MITSLCNDLLSPLQPEHPGCSGDRQHSTPITGKKRPVGI